MTQFFESMAMFGLKASYVIAASLAGVIAVLIDVRRYNFFTAVLAILAGALVAMLATDPIVTLLHLPETGAYAVAGALGVTGRNIIAFLSKASEKPLETYRKWRGK